MRIRTLGLNEAAEYLEMAARLIRIKAQMLLPRGDEEQWEDPRASSYDACSSINRCARWWTSSSGAARNGAISSRAPTSRPSPEPPQAPLALSLAELLSAVDRVLRAAKQPHMHEVIPRALDVPGAIATIRSVLTLRARILWTEILAGDAEPWQILSTLLGLLELAKLGELRVAQPKPFADVEITRDTASEAA
jgi:segregation and condensation protein A